MTEWSFDEETEGFGWFLGKVYRNKVAVVNEGKQDLALLPGIYTLHLSDAMPISPPLPCICLLARFLASMNNLSRFGRKYWRKGETKMENVPSYAQASQFILFGDSLTEWAFDAHNEGFGWYFEQKYGEKMQIQCEGTKRW